MDRGTKVVLIFLGIAVVFGTKPAGWFFVNVVIGSITNFFEVLEWASKTPQMSPFMVIISLLALILWQYFGDYILEKLRL